MKNNSLKKQANIFITISSCLGIFMVAALFGSNFAVKPTYSLDPTNVPDGMSCYKCTSGSLNLYIYATSVDEAQQASGNTGTCSATSEGNCSNECKTCCFECTKNGQKVYTYTSGAENAQKETGGSDCIRTTIDKCATQSSTTVTTNCYECDQNGVKKYLYATSGAKAAEASGGTNCAITSVNNCVATPSTVSNNPTTGTTGIIIAWVVGAFAIAYSIWYFTKINAIK